MDLLTLTQYDWFKDQYDTEDLKNLESNFKGSRNTRRALVLYLDHELDKLDKEMKLSKLLEVPDRAELALMVATRRDVLLSIRELILE